MSSTVKLTISTLMTTLAADILFASLSVTLVDSTSVPQTKSLSASDIPTPDADGKASFDVVFPVVAEGDFSVSIQALDSNGDMIGSAVTATDTVPSAPPGMAPLPVSVSITIG